MAVAAWQLVPGLSVAGQVFAAWGAGCLPKSLSVMPWMLWPSHTEYGDILIALTPTWRGVKYPEQHREWHCFCDIFAAATDIRLQLQQKRPHLE